jgi:hypothetical protein
MLHTVAVAAMLLSSQLAAVSSAPASVVQSPSGGGVLLGRTLDKHTTW